MKMPQDRSKHGQSPNSIWMAGQRLRPHDNAARPQQTRTITQFYLNGGPASKTAWQCRKIAANTGQSPSSIWLAGQRLRPHDNAASPQQTQTITQFYLNGGPASKTAWQCRKIAANTGQSPSSIWLAGQRLRPHDNAARPQQTRTITRFNLTGRPASKTAWQCCKTAANTGQSPNSIWLAGQRLRPHDNAARPQQTRTITQFYLNGGPASKTAWQCRKTAANTDNHPILFEWRASV